MVSDKLKQVRIQNQMRVLILVVMEYGLRRTEVVAERVCRRVLILVVMEYGLGHGFRT